MRVKIKTLLDIFMYGPELPRVSDDGFMSQHYDVSPILAIKATLALLGHHVRDLRCVQYSVVQYSVVVH
jgi:hypothetical protein